MDDAVVRAIARWPDVPDCHGWLALTRRGEWRIGAQRERIGHAGLIEFIHRNYLADPRGAWYFQNGPQRVWVSLDYTPLVYRLAACAPIQLVAHTGALAQTIRRVLVDELGSLIVVTDLGPGVVDDRDLATMLPLLRSRTGRPIEEAIAAPRGDLVLGPGDIAVESLDSSDIEATLAFRRYPTPDRPGQAG